MSPLEVAVTPCCNTIPELVRGTWEPHHPSQPCRPTPPAFKPFPNDRRMVYCLGCGLLEDAPLKGQSCPRCQGVV